MKKIYKHLHKSLFPISHFSFLTSQRGQLLIELLITIGLSAILIPALLTGLLSATEGKAQQQQRLYALSLLKETEEAVRFVQKNNWNAISVNNTYHPEISGTTWTLVAGAQTVNNYNQQVVISDVNRDASGAIVTSGGTNDPSTKKAEITISWTQPQNSTVTSVLYLTRTDNITHTDTTTTQFNAGTVTSAVVLATNPSGTPNDGQVQLGAGGGSQSDWCTPNLTITPHDLPKSGVANAITAIEGRAFAGTGDNASGVSFANINITNAQPPVTTTLGTFDGYKTNAVFGEANYAYLGTDNNSKEVEIINLTTSPYSEAGSFNAPGSGNGNSVFVTSSYGYMTSGSTLYNFRRVGSSATIDSNGVGLAGTGNKVYVVGNFAYVATSSTSNQLQIINISDPANLSVVRSISVAGQAGVDVYVNSSGTRAYLATGVSAAQRELFIIDIEASSPTYGQVKGSYEANGMSPKGITVVTNNKAVLVGTSGEEYQVISIVNEASPVRCGGLNINSGVNGVSSVLEADGDAYSYIITGDASSEFKIIEGGAGASFSSSGTFVSAPYDAGSTVAYNRFVATVSQPNQTTLKMQVAVAPYGTSCSSATYSFIGPNGTTDLTDVYTPSSGTIAELIPLKTIGTYENPGRCFKYKVWLDSTDSSQTPILYDVILNHSL